MVFARQIDFRASVATLGRWGDDLIDRFDGRTLVRSVRAASDQPALPFSSALPGGPADTIEVVATEDITAAVAATFVTADDALADLCRRDRAIATLAKRYPGLVPVLIPDPFHALVRSISAQQINLTFASAIRARLATRYGRRLEVADTFVHVLQAHELASASAEDLRGLQLTYAKARAVVATARAATAGELRREDLERLDDEQVIEHLTELPGIGRWSAEWFLARTLGRPRVVAGDLGVRKAIGRLYDLGMPSEDEVRRATLHWGAAATVAQTLALHDLAVRPILDPSRAP